jgi:hypothetical protein
VSRRRYLEHVVLGRDLVDGRPRERRLLGRRHRLVEPPHRDQELQVHLVSRPLVAERCVLYFDRFASERASGRTTTAETDPRARAGKACVIPKTG